MKHVKIFGLLALAVGFAACNNDADKTATTDTTTVDSPATATTSNSSVDYAAMSDSFRVNSEAGNYLDAKTGKPIRIRYDATSHRAVNEATGEPVWRYIDRRNWWVYGNNNDMWDTVGTARMQGNNVMYRGDDDTWITYDARWKEEDEKYMNDSSSDNKGKVSDDGNKVKDGEGNKVKVSDDGNKIKVNDQKIKVKDDKVKDKSDKQ